MVHKKIEGKNVRKMQIPNNKSYKKRLKGLLYIPIKKRAMCYEMKTALHVPALRGQQDVGSSTSQACHHVVPPTISHLSLLDNRMAPPKVAPPLRVKPANRSKDSDTSFVNDDWDDELKAACPESSATDPSEALMPPAAVRQLEGLLAPGVRQNQGHHWMHFDD